MENKQSIMKTSYLSVILCILSLVTFPSLAQTENNEPLLGLPGDDLDLYAVLDVFQNSKTIEAFEKSLNEENAGIVNLDLNNDGKVDFIKVVTEQDGDNFLFILQDDISETETQDVAVIAVTKDEAGKVSMQIIGDEELYGKDYVVEPRTSTTDSVTANPAYVGEDPVQVNVQATTEVVVVESTPVVQYVYSTSYVPYYPTYYYGYYPHWWRPVAVIGIGIYRHNHWYRHAHYRGGRYTNVNININNRNTVNHYNKNKRNTSNTVNNNIKNGNFKTAGQGGSRPSTTQNNRTRNGASTSNRASGSPSGSQNNRSSSPSTSQSRNNSNKSSSANRSSSPSSSNRSSQSRNMGSSSRSYSGGRTSAGRSGGGGRRR